MGAMTSDHGPAVGEPAPPLSVVTLAGSRIEIGGPSALARSRLVLFVSASCPVCKKLLPIARSSATDERLEVVLVGDGELAEQRAMIEEVRLGQPTFVHC